MAEYLVEPVSHAEPATSRKTYISAQSLLEDSFRLGMQIIESSFRPSFIVGIWRGGTPVGIAVYSNIVQGREITLMSRPYSN